MVKHYLIVQCFFCEIVNVIRGISLSQKNSAKELKCNQDCGSQRRTMLLIAQLLKCQLVFYMVQEKFWKINFYWWYYQNSYCCYHVADKWIFQNQRKLGPQRFFFKKVVVVMSWYHSVKIAGNLSNKKLSSACDFIWVLQFFIISYRYFV